MSEAQKEFISGIAAILHVTDEKILRKGVELISLLNSKASVHCSGTCKGIICLDIASSFSTSPINRDDAVKFSGCKKKTYINMYHNISKLLNLDKVYSIKEVCLLVGAFDVQESAAKLFEKFKRKCDKSHYDFDHPMYNCAAISAVCKHNKIKINKNRLVEISRMKRSELDQITKQFEDLIDIHENKIVTVSSQDMNTSSDLLGNNTSLSSYKRKASNEVMTDEEYLAWKKKMLED